MRQKRVKTTAFSTEFSRSILPPSNRRRLQLHSSDDTSPAPNTALRRSRRLQKVSALHLQPPAGIVGHAPESLQIDPDVEKEAREESTAQPAANTDVIEYDIPSVERKTTTFKGRLGYACLNTILRNRKPKPVFCSRTCRIATIEEKGMDFLCGLGLLNIQDLCEIIEWNEQNGIRFMRMSSEMFPFASHPKYGYSLAFAETQLKKAGELANKYHHRLTAHPGQFTQLASPKTDVVAASIRELEYHSELMDRMGLDQDSVVIIHMGGVYGDKKSAMARFRENYTTRLGDNVKRRLVLENDEFCYNLDDLLPLCEELTIPIVVDYHHDWIYPSSQPLVDLIPRVNKIWQLKGIKVKQHLSEARPGAVTAAEKRAHANRCASLPGILPDDVDLMIEAKDKEQAVFELRRIYGLEDPIRENLRPARLEQKSGIGRPKAPKRSIYNIASAIV